VPLPVGPFTVFERGMVRLTSHVVDVLDDVGGQYAALYPEKPIYDMPDFPRIDAAELVGRLRVQAAACVISRRTLMTNSEPYRDMVPTSKL
jgi:thioredoxin reductase (NADPH)